MEFEDHPTAPSAPSVAPARPGRSRFVRLLWLLVVLSNLMAWGLGGMSIWEGRQKAEEQAGQTTHTVAHMLDQGLVSMARTVDVVLLSVVAELERADGSGAALDQERVAELLTRFKLLVPEAEGLRIFDEHGAARWAGQGARFVNVADRAYFQQLKNDPRRGLLIASPVQGRATSSTWVVPFVRRFNHADGRFAGVVTAVVPLSTLGEQLARPVMGGGGSISLIYENYQRLSSYPEQARNADADARLSHDLSQVFHGLVDLGQKVESGWGGGGPARIQTIHRVEGLPFILLVELNEESYLAKWYADLQRTLSLLLAFLLVSGVSGLLLGRFYGRTQEDASRLLQAHQQQEAILNDLRDRDRALRATEQIGGLAVYSLSLHTRYIHAAGPLRKVLGLPPGGTLSLAEWLGMVQAADRERVHEGFSRALLGRGEPFDQEFRIVRPDGESRWVHVLGAMERDGEGGALRVHGVVQDVHSRKQAEESRAQAVNEYAKLVTRIPVGVFKLNSWQDRSSCFVYASPRFCEQLGLEPEVVLKDVKAVYRCINPEDLARFEARTEEASRSLQPFEWEGRLGSGPQERWVSVLSIPTPLGNGIIQWEGVQTDITDRKRAELAMRESEERYRLLLQYSPVGILHYDLDLRVSYCNEVFARIMGVPQDYMVNLYCNQLKDQRPLTVLEEGLKGQYAEYEGPYRTSYAGRDLFITLKCAPVRNASGQVAGGIAILQDATERLRKDKELERYRNQLEALVDERTAALEAARADAERLSRVKSEFLANMSHEIRTPLNGVLGMAQVGYRESRGRDRARDIFARIVSSGKLLLGLINDILDFSKIEAGKLHLESVPVDLMRCMGEVLELLEERASSRGLSVYFHCAPDFPRYGLADPLRLGQVLLNLLSNAIKFTEQGSVTLVARREGSVLCFEVHDTGIGMSPEVLAKIFTPFEQADNSTTRRFGGTGLGLTITRRLVELMDGQIEAASQAGQGSCFSVRLPWRAPSESEAACVAHAHANALTPSAGAHQNGLRLDGVRVLVAEDNAVNREVIEEMLRSEGAMVTLCCDGQEAVDCLRMRGPWAFDVVLMDVQMPVMDGREATRRMHTLAPGLPVIGQTAHAMDDDRSRCFGAGMVDLLTKPIDQDQMVAMVLKYVAAQA